MGDLSLPADTLGLVLFAYGNGSSRFSPRNRRVAEVLNQHHLGAEPVPAALAPPGILRPMG